jgi:hypothetical protein
MYLAWLIIIGPALCISLSVHTDYRLVSDSQETGRSYIASEEAVIALYLVSALEGIQLFVD